MKKKLITLFLACAMVLTMGSVAFAANDATLYTDLSAAKLDKELTVADGIDISAVKDFTFSFTAQATDTSTAAETPAVAVQKVTVDPQSGGKATGSIALSDVFNGASFPHAGVYMYEVAETTKGYADKAETGDKVETLTVDDAKYNVRVYVVNGDNNTTVIQGITVENAKTKEKVDPTDKGFIFKNEYKEVLEPANGVVLKVEKTITGAYADKTKKFPVTVKLTLPGTAAAADVALATDSKGTLSGTTVTADLADSDSIVFSKLPAGTTFTVSETQDTAYKSKITGFVATADTAYVEGDRTDVAGKEPVVEADETVSIENNRENLIPTGIVINNLPYIMLVAFAAAGILYLAKKRRVVE
jgi:hypothetical protein